MSLHAAKHVTVRIRRDPGPGTGEREDLCSAGASRVYSSAVEHRIADPAVAGSIPAAPFITFFFWFKPKVTCAPVTVRRLR